MKNISILFAIALMLFNTAMQNAPAKKGETLSGTGKATFYSEAPIQNIDA